MEAWLGVDVGTSSAKAVIVDREGHLLGEGSAAYDLLTPRPLWAEQWPEVWFEGMLQAVRGALQQAQILPRAVVAMGVSSLYGGSGIPVDRSMNPLGPCLIWLDRRAQEESRWVEERIPLEHLYALTGNTVDPYYGFTKILWLKRHAPELWSHLHLLLPPNAYFIWRLTGALAVDHSSAGNLGGLYDLGRRAWSDELCEALGVPRHVLPEPLVASSEIVGRLHREGAQLTGLLEGTPVVAGGIDAAVATLSAGIFEQGPHVAMMGTSMCWGFVHEGFPREPGFVSMPYVLHPERFTYTFGGAATAGAIVQWFRNELAAGRSYRELDEEARAVPAGSEGLLVLPYFMGERSPIWDPQARGTIVGLTLFHRRAHLYRAFLEGVAFALRHNLEMGMRAGYPLQDELWVVGGGARSPLWMQILADVTGRPVAAAAAGGEAALGDAMLAALGSGVEESVVRHWEAPRELYLPQSDQERYARLYPHYLGLYHDLKDRWAAMEA